MRISVRGLAWFGALWRAVECGTEKQRHGGDGGVGIEISVARILHLYQEGRRCAFGALRAQQGGQKMGFWTDIEGYFFIFRFGGRCAARRGAAQSNRQETRFRRR